MTGAWGDDMLDWDREDAFDTRKQVICDECGKVNLRGLVYRHDFETPRRLCPTCCEKHDTSSEVQVERFHLSAVEDDRDDF